MEVANGRFDYFPVFKVTKLVFIALKTPFQVQFFKNLGYINSWELVVTDYWYEEQDR